MMTKPGVKRSGSDCRAKQPLLISAKALKDDAAPSPEEVSSFSFDIFFSHTLSRVFTLLEERFQSKSLSTENKRRLSCLAT